VIPWLARHLVLSGYLLFPSTLISFPVAWRLPLELTSPIAPVITYWARTLSDTIDYSADLNWFIRWYRALPIEAQTALVIAFVVSVINLILVFVRRDKKSIEWGAWILLSASAIGLLFWFFMAPAYRFSGSMIWVLLISAILLLHHLLSTGRFRSSKSLIAFIFLFSLTLWLSPYRYALNINQLRLISPPPEAVIAAAHAPSLELITKRTASGLTVYMLEEPNGDCWLAPLPCTRSQDFYTKLSLIDPNDMQKGFYIQP
jgi:hypothetical protein